MRVEGLISLVVCIALASSKSLSEFRIFGGEDAVRGQFPYHASLRTKHNNKLRCGAAIISDRFLLTAAHCCRNNQSNPDYVRVVVGALRLSSGGTAMDVDKIIAHEEFDQKTAKNDIALIRTAKKIVFNDQVQPIALPNKDVVDGNHIISGWGTDGVSNFVDILQHAEVQVLNILKCRIVYYKEFVVYYNNICTIGKTNNAQPCKGDSGMIWK